jgi:hypothetical protein
MGMFDTILVDKSIIETIVDKEYTKYMESNEGYYSFQTKDLENFMWNYYIKHDYKLYEKKWGFDGDNETSFELVEPQFVNTTQYISFYDAFDTDKEHVFLTIRAKVIDGIVVETNIESIDAQNLEAIAVRNKQFAILRERQEAQWEMKLFRFLQTCEWKWHRMSYKLVKKYNNLKTYLRETAENKANKI